MFSVNSPSIPEELANNGRASYKKCAVTACNGAIYPELTINVPLFKKLRDIIFFLRDNNFLSHLEGHFEGAKTFLTP